MRIYVASREFMPHIPTIRAVYDSPRYRAKRLWAQFTRRPVPPHWTNVVTRVERWGCAPGVVLTVDEHNKHLI